MHSPWYLLYRRLGGPQILPRHGSEKEKIPSLLFQGIIPQLPGT